MKPTYVTFEQAKMLREKGFHSVKCLSYSLDGHKLDFYCLNLKGDDYWISRPEHWQVIEWLRVNHNIHIENYWFTMGASEYAYRIIDLYEEKEIKDSFYGADSSYTGGYSTPQEAISAAIDYTLKELI